MKWRQRQDATGDFNTPEKLDQSEAPPNIFPIYTKEKIHTKCTWQGAKRIQGAPESEKAIGLKSNVWNCNQPTHGQRIPNSKLTKKFIPEEQNQNWFIEVKKKTN